MAGKYGLTLQSNAFAIVLAFGFALFYNGAGHSLQWLAVCGFVIFAWLINSVARLNLDNVRIAWGWLPTAAIAYLTWLTLAPMVSTYPYASSNTAWALAVLPLMLLGWLMTPDEDEYNKWRATWRLLIFGSAVLAGWGIFDFLVLSTRAHGPLIDTNAYAALINLFLIPIAYFFLVTPNPGAGVENPRVLLGLTALLATAQFMSQSRGALLALLAILPFLLWFGRGSSDFRKRLPRLLLVLTIAFAVVKFGPFEQRRSLETLLLAPGEQMEQDPALSARLLMWKSTWQIIQDSNPLIGTGLGTYKNYYVAYREEMETSGNLAHNDYLQGLQEGGLIQLSFLLAFTLFAPIWLLYRIHWRREQHCIADASPTINGLMLSLCAVSLHALINFVHYVAPIALLTGLYLGHGWATLRPRNIYRLLPAGTVQIRQGLLKRLIIVILAVPMIVLLLDGAIFKIFSGRNSVFDRLDSPTRFSVRNVALTVRPGNPYPRASLIQDLLKAAHRERRPEVRKQFLERAKREAEFLATSSPGLASGRFLTGQIRAMKGTPEELQKARDDLEYAVKHVPPATGMRLELLRVYQRLGQHEDAYQSVRTAKKWVALEVNSSSLIAFAKEARTIALARNDREEADFWSSVVYSVTIERDTDG